MCIPVRFHHCFGMMGNWRALARRLRGDPGAGLRAEDDPGRGRRGALDGVPTMFIAEPTGPNFGTYDLSTLRSGVSRTGART